MPKSKAPAPPDDLVDRLLAEFEPRLQTGYWSRKKVTDVPAGKALLAADRDTQAAAVATVLDRLDDWETDYRAYQKTLGPGETNGSRPEWQPLYNRHCLLVDTLRSLLRRKLPLSEALLMRLLRWPLREKGYFTCYAFAVHYLTLAVEYRAADHGIGPKLRATVARLARRLRAATYDRDAPRSPAGWRPCPPSEWARGTTGFGVNCPAGHGTPWCETDFAWHCWSIAGSC